LPAKKKYIKHTACWRLGCHRRKPTHPQLSSEHIPPLRTKKICQQVYRRKIVSRDKKKDQNYTATMSVKLKEKLDAFEKHLFQCFF
jgi:hypothetical protein